MSHCQTLPESWGMFPLYAAFSFQSLYFQMTDFCGESHNFGPGLFPSIPAISKYSKSLSSPLNFVPRSPGSSLFFSWGNNTRILLLFSQSDREIQRHLWLFWGKQSRMNTPRDFHNASPAQLPAQSRIRPCHEETLLNYASKTNKHHLNIKLTF